MNMNTTEKPTYGDLTNLSVEKLEELQTVLTSILALPVARDTYAQIIDGRPTRTPFSDDIKAQKSHLWETIIINDNAKPSDHAMQQYEKIRTAFAPQNLRIDLQANPTQLAQNYQNAPPGSFENRLRILEITAAAVNALAGMIYASFHPDTQMKPPKPPEGHYRQFRHTDHFYVDFYHTNYKLLENYPFALLNVVGYWAEAELFGGVVLLERGKSVSQILNAFLHPQKRNNAFQLSEKQLNHFANLGVASGAAGSAGAETVIPFVEESDARTEFTFAKIGGAPLRIYKNLYDQPPLWYEPDVHKCVITKDHSRAAAIEEMMTIIEARGWNKTPPRC